MPSPNALNILRNTKRTRNTHQNEETETNIKNKSNSYSFYLQCQHEHTFFNPIQARPFFGAMLNGGGGRGGGGGGGGGAAWRISHTVISLLFDVYTNWARIFRTDVIE